MSNPDVHKEGKTKKKEKRTQQSNVRSLQWTVFSRPDLPYRLPRTDS